MLGHQIYLLGSPSGTRMQVAKPRGPDGFQILSVDKGGSAWRAGLRPGDVITQQLVGPVGGSEFEPAKDDFVDALCSLVTEELVIFKVRNGVQTSHVSNVRRAHISSQMVYDLKVHSTVVQEPSITTKRQFNIFNRIVSGSFFSI